MERRFSLSSSANFDQNGRGNRLDDSLLNSYYRKKSETSNNLNYNQLQRFYKPNNSFNYLAFQGGAQISSNNEYTKNAYPGDAKYNNNSYNLNGGISLGKGKGRVENVSDAVSAMFIIKDLQKKGGLPTLTDAQTEQIARGITTARNTRFIDFRFRVIDQVAMLDSFFTLAGAKPTNDLIYYTTLYDNWFYATQFSRSTGNRVTYYVNSSGSINQQNQLRENRIGTDYFKLKSSNTNLYNSLNLSYFSTKQIDLYHQRRFDFRLQTGLQHATNNQNYKDSSIGSYNEGKSKNKGQDAVISNVYASYSHLYQPNTRTYITWRVSETFYQNNSYIGLRTANLQKINNTDRFLSTNFELSYFRFFSPRLSINARLNANVYTRLDTRRNEVAYTPTNLFNFKSSNNVISGGIGVSAGLNYAVF